MDGSERRAGESFLVEERWARPARLAFAAIVILALPLLLWFGRHVWFVIDEWSFLAARSLRSPSDLIRPHNEHWTTLPIIAYRVLFRIFGLHSYVPYQALIVSLHLAAAVLLRGIMRRSGVGPWLATAFASLFVLFSTGEQNILWAFQIAFVGSLVLGLVHLRLADHDGPPGRRDLAGVGAGLGSLMCSGMGVAMVGAVGLGVLVRRGPRAAALHTLPLAAIFLAWFLTYRAQIGGPGLRPSALALGRFVWSGFAAALEGLGQVPGAGIALGAILLVGLPLAWRGLDAGAFRRRAAGPIALIGGAAGLLFLVGLGRAVFGPENAAQSRYVYLVAAMLLPGLAVAADAVVRRWRPVAPLVLLLVLVGTAGNVRGFGTNPLFEPGMHEQNRAFMATYPRLPAAAEVPPWVEPHPIFGSQGWLTLGWLQSGVEAGWLPEVEDVEPRIVLTATTRLSIHQARGDTDPRPCQTLTGPIRRTLEGGTVLRFDGGPLRMVHIEGDETSLWTVYDPSGGRYLHVFRGPLDMRLVPHDPERPVEVCG